MAEVFYSMYFDHYSEVPRNIMETLIKNHK